MNKILDKIPPEVGLWLGVVIMAVSLFFLLKAVDDIHNGCPATECHSEETNGKG